MYSTRENGLKTLYQFKIPHSNNKMKLLEVLKFCENTEVFSTACELRLDKPSLYFVIICTISCISTCMVFFAGLYDPPDIGLHGRTILNDFFFPKVRFFLNMHLIKTKIGNCSFQNYVSSWQFFTTMRFPFYKA